MALAALGVVFGDIGTSPLYSFETALAAVGKSDVPAAMGVGSLIIWSVLLIVSVKYVLVVMRADYHGEGGVFALLALLQKGTGKKPGMGVLPVHALLLLAGAAMLFGDGTITPAISVLSAMEGLELVNPGFKRYVIPVTVAILIALFSVQRLGTGRLGMAFGWVMLFWFFTIGGMGAVWICREPRVLEAFNPLLALEVLRMAGWKAFMVMGAVVLAVTGVEALYADMGHFSRRSIALAWHGVALPALLLNYLGQAALAVRFPEAYETGNPFFMMVPAGWPTLLLVILATLATVIASQALISGVFSLTAQAQELGYAPRINVKHTSRNERGQVYVPVVNWLLGLTCILLVLTFRSSENLAAAYGLAVVCTMVITTWSIGLVSLWRWKWRWWQTGLLVGGLLSIELPFFLACLSKLPDGGYFPVLFGGILLVVMLTWWKGRSLVLAAMRAHATAPEALAAKLESVPAAPGQVVFVSSNPRPGYGIARVQECIRRQGGMRRQVVLMSLVSSMESNIDMPRSVKVERHSERLWHVVARHGYMQEPHAPEILRRACELSGGGIGSETAETFYMLPRELIVEYVGNRMARWRRALFSVLSRNVSYAPDYYYIPQEKIVEFAWMIRG